jgi:thiol:disulfide interchange protein DsbC
MRVNRIVGGLILVALGNASAAVEGNSTALTALKEKIESRFPGTKIIDVQPAPVAGLYEIFTGDAIAYADLSGEHLFVGSLMNTATRENMTADRVNARNSVDFNSLPFDRAIKVVKGNGKRRLAVFADPDCPYCAQLEKELSKLADVTVYTFLYPLANIHPDAPARARAIWCAQDRSSTWTQWMLEKKTPSTAPECKTDPVDELVTLGRQLRINGTPTMYLENGRRVDGMVDAARLDKLLNEPNVRAGAVKAAAR